MLLSAGYVNVGFGVDPVFLLTEDFQQILTENLLAITVI